MKIEWKIFEIKGLIALNLLESSDLNFISVA